MADDQGGRALRDRLRSEIQVARAADLLPHHRRDALLIAVPDLDLLDAAVAIASDSAPLVSIMFSEKKLYKPSLVELSDWCVEVNLRFQYVILQPYVLAQALPDHGVTGPGAPNSELI